MNLVLNCFTIKYAAFSGRAPRKEYWLFALAIVILGIIAQVIENFLGLHYILWDVVPVGIASSLVGLGIIIPNTAVMVRRLHDKNWSGAWLIIVYLPAILTLVVAASQAAILATMGDANSDSVLVIAVIWIAGMAGVLLIPVAVIAIVAVVWLFVLLVMKGTAGENRFGPDPLAARTADTGETA